MKRRLLLLPVVAVAVAACGAAVRDTHATPARVERIEMEEMHISASRVGPDVEFQTYDAQQLFERGNAELHRGHCDAAIPYYERIASEFRASRFVSPGLYNLGHCLERLGRYEDAARRFHQLVEQLPRSSDVHDALFRLAGIEEHEHHWDALRQLADTLLTRRDLSSADRVEAMSRRATALLGLGLLDEAERQARDAGSYYRTHSSLEPLGDDTFAAQAQFTVAETYRLRAEAMALPDGSAQQQHEVLERRAQTMLAAQTEYFNTIRVTNPEWAAAAGYRIGETYRALFDAILAAPIPPDVPAGGAEVYRGELRSLFRPLLRNALRYWELTVLMNERTGVHNEWVERTTRELEHLRQMLLEDVPGSAAGSSPADAPAPTRPPTPASRRPPSTSAPAPSGDETGTSGTAPSPEAGAVAPP